jgi:hypothetical protein
MTKHTLVSIGWLGCKRVYLDVPLEEAKRRYIAAETNSWDTEPYVIEDRLIEMYEITDEFWAYDVGPGDDESSREIPIPKE